jgi:hypothetical protein
MVFQHLPRIVMLGASLLGFFQRIQKSRPKLRPLEPCVRLNPPRLTITSPKSFGVNVLHPALRFHRQQICIPASIAIDQQRRGGYVNAL